MSPDGEAGDDPWPDEPDEPDPESRWGDPERDLPRVPDVPDTTPDTGGDVDSEVAEAFWAAVVLANFGLLGVSLGAMLVFFREMWAVGGVLVVFGGLSLLRTYQHVRAFQSRDERND